MRSGVVDGPGDHLRRRRRVRRATQPLGDQRVVDPHRPDAELAARRRTIARQAGAQRGRAGEVDGAKPGARRPVAADLRQRPAALELGRGVAQLREAGDLHRRDHRPLRAGRARASAPTISSSRPATLRSRSKRIRVERRGGERVERLGQRQRLAAARRRPSRGRSSSGPLARRRAGRRRDASPRRGRSRRAGAGRRARSRRPRPRPRRRSSASVLPGTSASAPL